MSRRVVVLAPHCDDETLGVGGTIRRHVERGDAVSVIIATGGSEEPHPFISKARFDRVHSEASEAARVLGIGEPQILALAPVTYPDGPTFVTNRVVHEALEEARPNVLYVPFPYDLHNDHRKLFHAASVAWRPSTALGRGIQEILAYEVPSETHWQAMSAEPAFAPTVWHQLTEKQLQRKLEALACYQSQIKDYPATRSLGTVEHLARWRGSQMGLTAAEAFMHVRRVC